MELFVHVHAEEHRQQLQIAVPMMLMVMVHQVVVPKSVRVVVLFHLSIITTIRILVSHDEWLYSHLKEHFCRYQKLIIEE